MAVSKVTKFLQRLWRCRSDFLQETSFVEYNLKLLNVQGLWQNPGNPAARRYHFKYLYPRLVLVVAVVECFVTQGVDIIIFYDNAEFVCLNMMCQFMYGSVITSFFTLLTKQEDFRNLILKMETIDRSSRLGGNNAKIACTKCQQLCKMITIFAFVGTNIVFVGFVINFHIARSKGLVPANVIYFRAWYVFDETASPAWELTMAYRTIFTWMAMMSAQTVETILFMFLLHTINQYQILRRRMKNLRTEAYWNVAKRYQLLASTEPFEFNEKASQINVFEEMEKILIECLVQHKELNTFVKDYTKFFSLRLSFQVLSSLTGSCVFSLYIILTPGLGVQKLFILGMVVFAIAWFLLFAILASKVTDESAMLSHALYSSNWFDAPEPLKRSMRLMMTACQKPVVYEVMGFVPLSVETFASVFKAAYSYFKILWDKTR